MAATPFPVLLIAAWLSQTTAPDSDPVELRARANKGDAQAQFELGRRYAAGKGDAKDDVAATWFRLAAAQGHAQAQFHLGELHEQGKGIPQNDLEAFVLYSLASRHENQVRIFGAVQAKAVIQKRERVGGKLSSAQRAEAQRRIAAAEALVAVHPRRFGTATNVEKIRGWYIWKKFDPETWRAEVLREHDREVFQVRVLPWATTYRHLNYGVRPDVLLPGERINAFFSADENHPRGYLTHFQDEIGQMKGHGHAWQIRSVNARGFVAVGMAGEKPLDGKELTFELDPECRIWKAGQVVKALPYAAGDRVLQTWALRGERRVAMLVTDDASLPAIRKEQAERLDREIATDGVAGQVQMVEGTTVHLLVFATHWAQVGRLQEKQMVQLRVAGKSLRPTGTAVAAEITFRKNRGVYGSGPTDLLLRLQDASAAQRVRDWSGVVRVVAVASK